MTVKKYTSELLGLFAILAGLYFFEEFPLEVVFGFLCGGALVVAYFKMSGVEKEAQMPLLTEKFLNLMGGVFTLIYAVYVMLLLVYKGVSIEFVGYLFIIFASSHFIFDFVALFRDKKQEYSVIRLTEKALLATLIILGWIEILVSF